MSRSKSNFFVWSLTLFSHAWPADFRLLFLDAIVLGPSRTQPFSSSYLWNCASLGLASSLVHSFPSLTQCAPASLCLLVCLTHTLPLTDRVESSQPAAAENHTAASLTVSRLPSPNDIDKSLPRSPSHIITSPPFTSALIIIYLSTSLFTAVTFITKRHSSVSHNGASDTPTSWQSPCITLFSSRSTQPLCDRSTLIHYHLDFKSPPLLNLSISQRTIRSVTIQCRLGSSPGNFEPEHNDDED